MMLRDELEIMVNKGWTPVPTRPLTGNPQIDKDLGRAPHYCRPSEPAERERLRRLEWVDGHTGGIAVWLENTIVIDLDTPEAQMWAVCEQGRFLPRVNLPELLREGSERSSLWLSTSSRCHLTRIQNFRGIQGLDILTTGLKQIDLHWTGSAYKWASKMRPWLNPVPCPRILEAQLEPVETVSASTSPQDAPGREFGFRGMASQIAAYAAVVPPAVEGAGGLSATLKLTMLITKRFPLATTAEVLQGLSAWNAACTPPWNERDLTRMIEGARSK